MKTDISNSPTLVQELNSLKSEAAQTGDKVNSIQKGIKKIKIMKPRLSETWEAALNVDEVLSLEEMPFSVDVLKKTEEGYKIRISRK